MPSPSAVRESDEPGEIDRVLRSVRDQLHHDEILRRRDTAVLEQALARWYA